MRSWPDSFLFGGQEGVGSKLTALFLLTPVPHCFIPALHNSQAFFSLCKVHGNKLTKPGFQSMFTVVTKKRPALGKRETGSQSAARSELGTAEQIMQAATRLYIKGQHLTVGGIAQESGKTRVTVSALFKDESGAPTVKAIEDRIIAAVLSETRAAIFDYLRKQGPLVVDNPLDQLITVFRAILDVFNSNPMGKFVAHRLTDLQENETLTLMFSRVEEMLWAAKEKGQLEEQSGQDLRRLRLMLFGMLRGLLTLLPTDSPSGATTADSNHATRAGKAGKGKQRSEPITAQHIEVEFMRIIQLHVSDAYKGHVNKYIEAARAD